MRINRLTTALVFVLGTLVGGLLVHSGSTSPALAQAMPMSSSSPMPMATGNMPPGGMMSPQMMQTMMPAMKSDADRGYMGAMMQMHGGMMRMTLTGNADHDFLVMMIPHHQAAVAMAQTDLQYGHDPKVRALATRIISAQQAEIREMQLWIK